MSVVEGVLESLLSLKPKTSTNKTTKDKEVNFLEELLKSAKENPKIPNTLLQTTDTKKTDIKEIKLPKKEVKSNQQELQNQLPQITQDELLKTLNTIPQLQNASKEEKLEFTKKIVESKIKLQNITLSDKEIKEFKEIKSFKELISFANKKNLNIQKIVIQYSKNPTKSTQIKTPKPKIIPLNTKTQIKTPQSPTTKNQNQKQPIKSQPKSNSHILSNLLQKSNQPKATKINSPKINTQNQIKTDSKNTPKNTTKTTPKLNSDNLKTSSEAILNQNNKQSLQHQINKNHITKENTQHTQNSTKESQPDIIQNQTQHINIINELKTNIKKAKETIKHFATSLQKSIEDYKPPISKISIEMNPKEIGKVEVTLIHRGDNLQIQINSNNTAINLLNTHQQELKQNLINMGYNEVNMSFNSNSQNQQQKHNNQNQQKKYTQEDEELIIEIPYQYA